MAKIIKVIMGGTFGILHKGHMAFLKRAFKAGDYVYIGLTTDRYARSRKTAKSLPSYTERKNELDRYVRRLGKRFDIKPLSDRFGPSTVDDFDVIVVSEGTFPTALEINRIRRRRGLKSLRIIKVKHVLAEDLKPISSSRIAKEEIDREGNIAKGIKNI